MDGPSPLPFTTIAPATAEVAEELEAAWRRVLAGNHFILGPELEAFEAEFAAYCGARHCIGVSDGLAALQLSLLAMDIGPGDEVIVPTQTFIATWLAVTGAGATPIGVEPDARNYTLDVARIAAAITPRTRAIMPVHLYGHPAAMDEIMDLAQGRGIAVIEDAAQAHGARYKGRPAGGLGTAAGFSFYPTKNLGAFGDGGAVVTQDTSLATRLRKLRNYGSERKYHHEVVGTNSRLDELQAAFLRIKLRRMDDWNAQRRARAQTYDELLRDIAGIERPTCSNDVEHAWHLYVIRVRNGRDDLARFLTARGIQTMIHYPCPPHLQPAYERLGAGRGAFPIAEALADEVLSLPFWPQIPESAIARVTQAIGDWAGKRTV